jgi:hypothetical protein
LRVAKEINKNCTAGSNLGAALLSLTLSLVNALVNALANALANALVVALVTGLMLVNLASEALATALGIFFRLQVTDFDVFCLSHFVICPLLAC